MRHFPSFLDRGVAVFFCIHQKCRWKGIFYAELAGKIDTHTGMQNCLPLCVEKARSRARFSKFNLSKLLFHWRHSVGANTAGKTLFSRESTQRRICGFPLFNLRILPVRWRKIDYHNCSGGVCMQIRLLAQRRKTRA